MADTTITALPPAVSIDGAADWLAIDTASPNSTNKINRNTFLGVSGQPMDINSVQTVSNKILNSTNSITIFDGVFTIQDDVDPTKQGRFQLSSITTATTRTLTWPNSSGTIATLTGTETFTNKTLTSPAITGGTIDNSTITVDSISGHTSATLVSVAGLSISAGVLNTNNSVITSNIADGAVTPAKLQSGTGTGWAWQAYTVTLTNITLGDGTKTAKYIQIGKTVFYTINLTFGSTTSIGGAARFSLPVTSVNYGQYKTLLGSLVAYDSSTTIAYSGDSIFYDTNTVEANVIDTTSTYASGTSVTSTVPMTWDVNDELEIIGFFEAA